MPERQPIDQSNLKKDVVEGRMVTLQIKNEPLSLSSYKLAALNSGSTVEVITDSEGEKYPTRERFIYRLTTNIEDGSVQFYKWRVSIGTVRTGNIVIGVTDAERAIG